jgi:hypothetical protein
MLRYFVLLAYACILSAYLGGTLHPETVFFCFMKEVVGKKNSKSYGLEKKDSIRLICRPSCIKSCPIRSRWP